MDKQNIVCLLTIFSALQWV